MKKAKRKYTTLQVLKRFLKENRDLIKFFYMDSDMIRDLKNNKISIYTCLGNMICRRAKKDKVFYADLIRDYSKDKETYSSISRRMENWLNANGFYDAYYFTSGYVIKKRKMTRLKEGDFSLNLR